MLAGAGFSLHAVTVSAEREDGPVPGARVTWSTTAPPECVASFRVEFRTRSPGSVQASYNTTDISQREVIQTGLQGDTSYYVRVVVTGISSLGLLISNEVQVLVGGNSEVTAYIYVAVHYHELQSLSERCCLLWEFKSTVCKCIHANTSSPALTVGFACSYPHKPHSVS